MKRNEAFLSNVKWNMLEKPYLCIHERASFARIFFMVTLIASIVGLKMI